MNEKTHVDLILHSARQVLTLTGGPQRGIELGSLGIITDGAVAVRDGIIIDVGASADIRGRYSSQSQIDVGNRVLMPGLVDPHTHLIWAGDRAEEFEMRVAGATYMEIMAAGGGIASTVAKTRAASCDELVQEALPRVRRMLAHGTTTAEAKTGYGLELQSELRMLEAILELDHATPLDLVPTFLAAHALPPEYIRDASRGYERYTEDISETMLPAVKDWWSQHVPHQPMPFVDVFCERGAFSLEQSRRILETAREYGFPLKIHADEFEGLGGTGLAVELGAVSADHLVQTPPRDIAALGRSSTVAVSLPCTPFGLGEQTYTFANDILAADGILALATDLNPGTAWCENMQFAIALACRYMHLTPAQAIAAATINAAAAIGKDPFIGSIQPGKQADMIILDAEDYRHLGYRFGVNLVSSVIKRGNIIEV
jgi:imidazolonepropionase